MSVKTHVDQDILALLDDVVLGSQPCILWLMNDDHHSMDEVVMALLHAFEKMQLAISVEAAVRIMYQAHQQGQAVVVQQSRTVCEIGLAVLLNAGLDAAVTEENS